MQKLMMTVMAAVAAFATRAGTYSLTINETWDDAKIAEMAAAYDGVDLAGGATLTFQNAGAVTFDKVISGSGNVTKEGVGTLTLTGVNTFTGELRVGNGVLKTDASIASAAKTNLGNPSKITVADGATLDVSEAGSWDTVEILSAANNLHIAGNGYNGQGAIRRTSGAQSGYFGAITLDADATFYHGAMYGGNLNLNGHAYTVDGSGSQFRLLGQTVTPGEGGSIVAKRDIQIQNNWGTDANLIGNEDNWLRLRGGNLTLTKLNPIPWTLSVESSATLTAGKPNVSTATWNTWAGPVAISNGVTLTVTSQNAEAPLVFKEKVTGAEGGNVTFSGLGPVTMEKGLSIRQHSAWDSANGVLTMSKDSGTLRIDGGCDLQQLMGLGGRLEIVNGEINGLGSGISSFYQRAAGLTANTSYACFSNVTFKTAASSRYWMIGDMDKTAGILELDKGTKANLRGFLIGSDSAGTGNKASWGAIYQHDGVDVSTVNDANEGRFRMASGVGSYGYYGMSGGTFSTVCTGYVADNGFAVFRQSGGTVTHNADVAIATNGGEAVVWQTGGTSDSRYRFDPNTPDGAKVTLAVEGEGTSYTFKGGTWNQRLGFSSLNDVTLTIAANDGGELKTVRLDRSSDANSRAKFYVSFNGGKMHPTLDNEIFNEVKPSALLVQEGGLVYDTSDVGAGKTSIVKCAIEAPTGRIVSEIALPDDAGFTSEPYIGSPKVTIAGAGVGAAAVAVFDEKTRKVTGVHVLASGTGYDEMTTATIESADRTKTYACAVTTVEAPTTGKGLRKIGSNALELRGANTFRGPAVVETGTLTFTGPTAVPEGMGADVWQNATLNLGADIRCLSDLKGCGTVTCDKAVSVTNALVLAATNSALTVTAQSFTLADNVRIEVPNFDEIRDGAVANFALLSVPGGITYEGEVVLPDVGDGWKVRCKSTGIELKRRAGFSIILR